MLAEASVLPSSTEHWRTWDKHAIHRCLQCLVRSWHTTCTSRMAGKETWPAVGPWQQQASGLGVLGSGKTSTGTDGMLTFRAALYILLRDNEEK